MGRLVGQPSGNRVGKGKFGPCFAQQFHQLRPERRTIERHGHVSLVGIHGLALDELALDRKQRGQFVMPRFERADGIADAEQRPQKVLEMGCYCQQEVGLGQRSQAFGGRTRLREPTCQRGIGGLQMRTKRGVDALRAIDRMEIGERESVSEFQHGVR